MYQEQLVIHRPNSTSQFSVRLLHKPRDQADEARTLAYRQQLRETGVYDYEQVHTYASWQDQRSQLLSLDRQYVLDLARDHLWRYDQSPYREQQRYESMARTLDHAMKIERQPTIRHERIPSMGHSLRELVDALGHDEPAHVGPGIRVKLHEQERDQGYGLGF